MIIAVDFDGTLHDAQYPAIGSPLPGAVEVMQQLRKDGHTLIIWTCRAGVYYDEMLQWLDMMQIPFDLVNEHDSGVLKAFGVDTRKIYADIYIDDHNVGGIPSWNRMYKMISNNC